MLLFLLSITQNEADKIKIKKLYEEHSRAIERAAYKLTRGNKSIAEDAIQETWLAAIQRMPTKHFENSYSERAYLYAILRSKICDTQKSRGRITEHETFEDNIDMLAEHLNGDPLEWICTAEAYQKVTSIIHRLSLQDQESIIVYMREDESVKQMAAALNLSPSVARTRLNRARKRLTKLCEKEGIIHE